MSGTPPAGFGASTRPILRQFVVFALVGVVVAGLYVGTMAIAVEVLHVTPTLGAIMAFTVGTLVSYVGNAMFAFQAPLRRSNFWRFVVVVLVGLGLNAVIAQTLAARGWHHVAISLAILLTVPVVNFVGHRLWTFR